MKVIAKYVTVEAVKDKKVLTLLFLDWKQQARLLGSRQGTRHETAHLFHRFQGP